MKTFFQWLETKGQNLGDFEWEEYDAQDPAIKGNKYYIRGRIVDADFNKEEPRTWNYPGVPAYIEINDIVIDKLARIEDEDGNSTGIPAGSPEYKAVHNEIMRTKQKELEEIAGDRATVEYDPPDPY